MLSLGRQRGAVFQRSQTYLSRAFDYDRVARMHLLQATVCQEENLVATWKLDQSGEKARGRWVSGWIFAVILFLNLHGGSGFGKKISVPGIFQKQ